MSNQYNEESKVNNEMNENESEYAYKIVADNKPNRRTLSIISLVFSVLSVVSVFVPWLGLVFSLISAATGAFSRKNLGYFDKLTLAALIIDIFCFVFAVVGLIFGSFISFFFL